MNTPFKHLTLVCSIVTAPLLVSCSHGGAPVLTVTSMEIAPGVGVGPIKFGMTLDEVKRALGEPDRTPGKPLQYLSLDLAVIPNHSDGKVGAIMMGDTGGGQLVERFKGATKEGIKMKSTRQEIVAAYG
ncbi:MAG: hypothetical protein ABI651_11025 [Verrucomicrobiota bacterium]